MLQRCSRCARVNPGEALYCYFDGFGLVGAGGPRGPVNMGAQPFLSPFVFPSGHICNSFDQLALACVRDPLASMNMLQGGQLAGFLGLIGRNDLAQSARDAAKLPSKSLGLDTFLGKLPTNVLQPPVLQLDQTEISLGQVRRGEARSVPVLLANQGQRLLLGSLTCEAVPWLSFADGSMQKVFQIGNQQTLDLLVHGDRLPVSAKPLQARVLLESNGGNKTITLTVTNPVAQPFQGGVLSGVTSPRQLAEKARLQPREASHWFENGAVARWYQENGWTYPVRGPASSGLGAIQQFFEALGLAKPPKVVLSQNAVHLQGSPGEALQQSIEVRTQEQRAVFALASSNADWLKVTCPTSTGQAALVHLAIPAVPSVVGQQLLAQVQIVSNGEQRFVLPVSLTIRRTGEGPTKVPTQTVTPAVATPAPVVVYPPPVPAVLPQVHVEVGPEKKLTLAPNQGSRRQWQIGWALSALLALILVGFLIRDLFVQPASGVPNSGDELALLDPHPRVGLLFHDRPDAPPLDLIKQPTLRFGLVSLEKGADPAQQANPKKLTYSVRGRTNNTCLRIDSKERLFGHFERNKIDKDIADWQVFREPLGKDATGRLRQGERSVWLMKKEKITITQTVEIVPGPVSRLLDTCLIRYTIENQDTTPHQVGLRFMLDTFIGENDGVPFTLPGIKGTRLCNTLHEFRQANEVPDFLQALEYENLDKPGTVAHLQLKVGGHLEAPQEVTLGAWPDRDLHALNALCNQHETLWQVPVLSMKRIQEMKKPADSCVVMYWLEQELKPGTKRELGFAYGLGSLSSGEGGGELALTVGGSFQPREPFSLTAYIKQPTAGQRVTVHLPAGLVLAEGVAEQEVPAPTADAGSRIVPVTWKVRADQAGVYTLRVSTNTKTSQSVTVRIKPGLFD